MQSFTKYSHVGTVVSRVDGQSVHIVRSIIASCFAGRDTGVR